MDLWTQGGVCALRDSIPGVELAAADAGEGLHELRCVSFGVPFRLVAGNAALLAEVRTRLPHATEYVLDDHAAAAETFRLLPPSGGRGFRCYAGAQLSLESPDPGPVLEQLGRDLMVHVANLAPDFVFVHAGVVAWKGGALLLPGPSFAGKTTLTAALVRRGAAYYSDEYAVVDAEGAVHPYARDLQVRQPGLPGQHGVSAEALGGECGTEPLRVRQVWFARYRAGAAWQPVPVSRGMAVLEMLRHTIPVQRTPARVMSTLAAMLAGASCWRSDRDEADAVADAMLRATESSVLNRPAPGGTTL